MHTGPAAVVKPCAGSIVAAPHAPAPAAPAAAPAAGAAQPGHQAVMATGAAIPPTAGWQEAAAPQADESPASQVGS